MKIYVDNAATTKISDTAFNSMLPYLKDNYGNASSIYSLGRESKIAIENSRKQVADAIGASHEEIYFTAGGSESNNWAIKGVCQMMSKKNKKHIITSAFEHHAVLNVVETLEKQGWDVTYLPVYSNGVVKPEDVKKAMREDTALVTIMYVNNEIGTIQPIEEIGKICRENKVIFHTDAVQAVGNLPIDVIKQNIDLLSLSGHKFHAPKGVGALYMKKGIRLPSLIEGGAQEKNKRAGTENVPSIVAMGAAITEAMAEMKEKNEKLLIMKDKLIQEIMKIDRVHLNGDKELRVPGNINFSFEGIEGESLLLLLDMKGIMASSGSACTSGSLDPSHVLIAIGLEHSVAHGSLRISLSEYNTMEEIEYIIQTIPDVVTRLRAMSPLWETIIKNSIK